jgi:lipoprotein-anchoring transpeptidase ErfK/SrfK
MTPFAVPTRRAALLGTLSLLLAACVATRPGRTVDARDALLEGDHRPPPDFRRTVVAYAGAEPPGTVVIDTKAKVLYLIEDGGRARRYGVGVGREGFGWTGTVTVGDKQTWPRWFPPKEMIARERARGRDLPAMMEGGPDNPLGARALYLYDGPKDTLYRIHGTIEPWTIGTNVSSGCIRMANDDVMDLYDRIPLGTRVTVR